MVPNDPDEEVPDVETSSGAVPVGDESPDVEIPEFERPDPVLCPLFVDPLIDTEFD